MLENMMGVAVQVMTLFVMMGVGFVLRKRSLLTETGTSQMSFVLTNIVTPCVIIHSLQTEKTPELLQSMGKAAGILAGFYVVGILLTFFFFRKEPETTRKTLRYAVIYCNTGFMGLPLVQAVLGDEALIYATISVVMFNLFTWTHGAMLMGGKAAMSVKKALLNPGTVALFVGFPLFLLSVRLPSFLGNSIGMLADLNTPLAMLVIGSLMGTANLKESFTQKKLYLTTFLRLILVPAIVLLALAPLKLDYLLYATCVILCSSPVAGMTPIFAVKFGGDTVSASQSVTLSTLLSILTMPVFAALVPYFSR